ncbi:hypothetical protein ACPOL_0626 [Acidisarcina polymorpha]|uniref:Uncharacterized protein n=1 Tax=Acidisarcina polymorpha TaxID=2211140 RepID=A0A2Z5FU18_9BACT|nr:hypothetical protein ACPOL_0626 [Acidisarcina polymorpha]
MVRRVIKQMHVMAAADPVKSPSSLERSAEEKGLPSGVPGTYHGAKY